MARAFDDDLRRKFFAAYDRGGQSVRDLTDEFGVSYGWGRKVIDQRKSSGQAERVRHRPGPRSQITPELQLALGKWVQEQPDRTLAELQQLLAHHSQVQVSTSLLCRLLKRLGLRQKKSDSPGSGAMAKRSNGGANPPSGVPARSRGKSRSEIHQL